ncbi:hypothetical protein BAE44_0012547 [Dichanthelium oligosanthes]|uniref:Bifunctional inhibitor/plant lipid transfer protein/seed storage helical domain-containing protein n=1 Tax=Dichanthelium oligosanthes TaxID=888268 RepID=A0A1E5VMS8_9POAL|nr:hypothetical protein BAE44_0012547 [Dichanthelium oligosanthes]
MSQLSSSRRSLQAATILLLPVIAAAATIQAPAVDEACHNDIIALRSTCYEYVQEGTPTLLPSPSCCATMIGVTNVRCVCNYLGSDINVDLDKVFYVIIQCGVTIPRNCGGLKHTTLHYNKNTNQLVKSQSTKEHTKLTQLSSAACLAATLLLLAAVAAAVSGQPSPQDEVPACQNDIDALWRTCKLYVQKEGPS